MSILLWPITICLISLIAALIGIRAAQAGHRRRLHFALGTVLTGAVLYFVLIDSRWTAELPFVIILVTLPLLWVVRARAKEKTPEVDCPESPAA